jgi:hypothetical protein
MLQAGCRGVYEPEAVVRHWVPRERLERGYFRRWMHQNGRDVAKLETAYTPALTRVLGVPRYLWRQAAGDVAASAAAVLGLDDQRWLVSTLRLVWFAGYVRETWSGAPAARLKGSRSSDLQGSRSSGEPNPSLAPRSASPSGERNRAESTQVAAAK